MPTISLTDKLGLDLDAQPAPTSALLKYFQQIPALRLDSLDLAQVGGLTLDQPALRSLTTGVSFQNPVSLGSGAPSLSIGAGVHGSIRLLTDADDLPGSGDLVTDLSDACYVCAEVEANASADISGESGVLQFGATPSASVTLSSGSRFPLHAGVTLLEAVRQTVANLAIPAISSDLADLAPGQLASVSLHGKLSLSGDANLLAMTNPLAAVSLPAPLPSLSVSAGGSVTVGVSCEIEADYQFVAARLDNGTVRLGWYRTRETDVSVSANAREGVSAGIAGHDLFTEIVGAISANPKADLAELASAGVPDGQAADIQAAVRAAVSRKLQIAVGAAFSASATNSATFLYDVVPAALTPESREAVDRALRGDLTALHAPGLAGISCIRSLWDSVRQHGLELDVNLLGIFNFRSVTSLSLEGKVLCEPATGSLVITDSATAKRIQSAQVNFGADTQKLRHVLAESFLLTAAYRGALQEIGAPTLTCSHSCFELQNSTSRADMSAKLRTGVALGLLPDAELPAGTTDFGRTTFAVSTDYDNDLVARMFLDPNGTPLPRECYENAGRTAIQFLVQEGDDDEARRLPAIDNGLWAQMKELGQPGIPRLFPALAAPLAGAIVADYTTIQWWADAMSGAAQQLAAVRTWLNRNPLAGPDDPDFQKLRADLAHHLGDVAATTREEFGQPWGLIAMNQLAARGGARILIAGPLLVRQERRALVAGVTG